MIRSFTGGDILRGIGAFVKDNEYSALLDICLNSIDVALIITDVPDSVAFSAQVGTAFVNQ